MKLIPPSEAARRARAAIAYAGIEVAEVAERTGIAPGTLRNILSRTAPKSGRIERLWAIADACGVPRVFMEEGFGPLADRATSLEERIGELEASVRQLLAERDAATPSPAEAFVEAAEEIARTRAQPPAPGTTRGARRRGSSDP